MASTFQVFHKNYECFRRVTMRAACPFHPSALYFVTTIMFDEMDIFWSTPLCTFPHTPRNLFFRTKYSVSILKHSHFVFFFSGVKLKFTVEQATKAQSGSRGTAILFNIGAKCGWVVNATPRATLPPGEARYLLYRTLGGPQGRSTRVRKISPPPRFFPRTAQPVVSRYTD